MSAFLASGEKYLGEVIGINTLVFQNGNDVFAASNDVTDRAAYGVAVLIDGSTIYHTPYVILEGVTVGGTPDADNMAIYLGVDGAMTFDATGAAREQQVGFAVEEESSSGDSKFKVMININMAAASAAASSSSSSSSSSSASSSSSSS
jgi:hypothetical protein